MMNIYQMYCCAVFAEHTKYYSVLCTSMYKGNMTHNYRKYCCVAFKYFCQYCAPVCIRGEDDEHLSNEKEPAPRATWLYPPPLTSHPSILLLYGFSNNLSSAHFYSFIIESKGSDVQDSLTLPLPFLLTPPYQGLTNTCYSNWKRIFFAQLQHY